MIEQGVQGAQRVWNRMQMRAQEDSEQVRLQVVSILREVRLRKDEALAEYAKRFDETDYAVTPLRVSEEEIEGAYAQCDAQMLAALRASIQNVRAYHLAQVEHGYEMREPGKRLKQIVRPLACVGVYVPGGTAAYPSSVVMNVVPAKIAGVQRICMATPAKNGMIAPLTLVAAKEAGVDEIYRMGGAQAIAAFAYGTQTIPQVDKITGPGNLYVALAKKEVYGTVGIDAIAGPSEVLILADQSARADFIAADMLAQAEHDARAAAICVTDDLSLAQRVQDELDKQLATLPRKEITRQSLDAYGAIVVLDDMDDCFAFANRVAPEHLELLTQNAWEDVQKLENAGGVFVGPYAPEALGDYMAGTNHVLPTAGTARFASPLGVYDFVKRMSVLYYEEPALRPIAAAVDTFAQAEGLQAHGRSAMIRIKGGEAK